MSKINSVFIASVIFFAISCKNHESKVEIDNNNFIGQHFVKQIIDSLIIKFPNADKLRLEKGVNQVSKLWQESDGTENDFKKFCFENFEPNVTNRLMLFHKLSRNFEILNGNFNKIAIELKKPLHLDMGEITNIDELFGSYEATSHLSEDFYNNKIAFIVALNFPYYTLSEKYELSKNWSSQEWAFARMGDIYTSRIPSEILQDYSVKSTNADTYISEYNIYMGKLINSEKKAIFPEDMKLITHWGLRDELKSNYNADNGFEKQKMIYAVMKNIISQQIPQSVINNNENLWNPVENKLFKNYDNEIHFTPEPNTRYQHLLNIYNSIKNIDKYSISQPTYIQRKFEGDMELTQAEVENLFIEYVSSPVVKEVAELIKKRLGRNLEPFDIWYDGFKSRSNTKESDLDKLVSSNYPNRDAFQKDLTPILIKLGFNAEKAKEITSFITVDASRGAGHAWGAEMRTDNSRLRTRIGKDGMNYKGYNIAVHEFGHNVEQTISLHDVDFYALRGVPNTAFTEALAFVFQERDLELLGMKNTDINKKHMMALDNFWSTYEIMGVSLVDMNVWKWLYENPNANAEELKNAVNRIAIEVWNKYYSDVFGIKDQPILAIYSHMIDAPLYLSAYPIGLLIQFQLEKHFESNEFAPEVLRIYKQGRLIPQTWMKKAVGSEISAKPMIDATSEALKHIK